MKKTGFLLLILGLGFFSACEVLPMLFLNPQAHDLFIRGENLIPNGDFENETRNSMYWGSGGAANYSTQFENNNHFIYLETVAGEFKDIIHTNVNTSGVESDQLFVFSFDYCMTNSTSFFIRLKSDSANLPIALLYDAHHSMDYTSFENEENYSVYFIPNEAMLNADTCTLEVIAESIAGSQSVLMDNFELRYSGIRTPLFTTPPYMTAETNLVLELGWTDEDTTVYVLMKDNSTGILDDASVMPGGVSDDPSLAGLWTNSEILILTNSLENQTEFVYDLSGINISGMSADSLVYYIYREVDLGGGDSTFVFNPFRDAYDYTGLVNNANQSGYPTFTNMYWDFQTYTNGYTLVSNGWSNLYSDTNNTMGSSCGICLVNASDTSQVFIDSATYYFPTVGSLELSFEHLVPLDMTVNTVIYIDGNPVSGVDITGAGSQTYTNLSNTVDSGIHDVKVEFNIGNSSAAEKGFSIDNVDLYFY